MSLTEQELAMRKNGVCASDIAAIAGVNPWSSAIDVYLRKVGEDEGFTGNWTTEVGHRLEKLIADWYGKEVGAVEMVKGTTIVHPNEPWIMATPDFYTTILN